MPVWLGAAVVRWMLTVMLMFECHFCLADSHQRQGGYQQGGFGGGGGYGGGGELLCYAQGLARL